MSNENNGDIHESSTAFYRKMDEELDNVHETMKENLRTLPKAREEVADHHVTISSLIDPRTTLELEHLAAKTLLASTKADARLDALAKQHDEAAHYLLQLQHRSNDHY